MGVAPVLGIRFFIFLHDWAISLLFFFKTGFFSLRALFATGLFLASFFSPKVLFSPTGCFPNGLFPNGLFYRHVFRAFFLFLMAYIIARGFSFFFPPNGLFFCFVFSCRGVAPTLVGKQR